MTAEASLAPDFGVDPYRFILEVERQPNAGILPGDVLAAGLLIAVGGYGQLPSQTVPFLPRDVFARIVARFPDKSVSFWESFRRRAVVPLPPAAEWLSAGTRPKRGMDRILREEVYRAATVHELLLARYPNDFRAVGTSLVCKRWKMETLSSAGDAVDEYSHFAADLSWRLLGLPDAID